MIEVYFIEVFILTYNPWNHDHPAILHIEKKGKKPTIIHSILQLEMMDSSFSKKKL